jgi:hypothetical protein
MVSLATILLLLVSVQGVHAQGSTQISDVQYPNQIVVGSSQRVSIGIDLSYSGVDWNQYRSIAVLLLNSQRQTTLRFTTDSASISTSPDSCTAFTGLREATETQRFLVTACVFLGLRQSSGQEHWEFKFSPSDVMSANEVTAQSGTWDLTAYVGLWPMNAPCCPPFTTIGNSRKFSIQLVVATTSAVYTQSSQTPQMPLTPQTQTGNTTIIGGVIIVSAILIGTVALVLYRRKNIPQQEKAVEQSTDLFCIECGTKLSAGSEFCNKCGAKQP